MKMFFLFACLFVTLLLSSQNGVVWSSPTSISTNGNSSPVIRVLEDGTPVAIFGKNGKIYFTKKVGQQFIEPIELDTDNISPDIYSFGGIDLASNGNDLFIVFEDFASGVFLIRSNDGGETFSAPVNAYDPIAGKWTTLPSVAVDGNGNPLISVILEKTNETEGQYIVITSDDGGLTFNEPIVGSEAADGEYVCECCPSGMVSKGDTIWLVFRNNDNNKRDMWVARSTDNGSSFTEAIDIDKTDWIINACPISGPNIAPMAGDSLISIWMSAANGPSRVYLTTLDGNTMQKGAEAIIPLTGDGIQINPDVAGGDGYVGMVWEESGFGVNSSDILFAYSQNGSLELVNNIANLTDTLSSQKLPSIAYHNHTFHLIYTEGLGIKYQSGTIETLNALQETSYNDVSISLVNNPIVDRKIAFTVDDPNAVLFFNAKLLDIEGKVVDEWQPFLASNNKVQILNTHYLSTGIYLLHLSSKEGTWMEKIFVE